MAMERLTSGQVWHPPTSADQQTLADVGDEYRRRAELSKAPKLAPIARTSDVLKVENQTGAPLGLGYVVEVGDAVVSNINRLSLAFQGLTPVTLGAAGNYAILREPLQATRAGTGQVAGLVEAKVNILDTSHLWATPVVGKVILDSAESGKYRIWYSPGLVGEQDCIVMAEGALTTECRWMVMRENLLPGEQNKKAAFAVYNSTTDKWEDDGSDPTGTQLIYDDGFLACLAIGEFVWVCPRPIDPTNNPDGLKWDVVGEIGLKRRVKILADIPAGASGLGRVWFDQTRVSCVGFESQDLDLTICNNALGFHRDLWGEDTPAGTNGHPQDFIWVGYDKYGWSPLRDVHPTQAKMMSAGNFCQDSSVTTTQVVYQDWKNGDGSTANTDISSVDNEMALAGNSADDIDLRWNETNAAGGNKDILWTIRQVTHKAQDVVEGIADDGVDCPEINASKERVILMKSLACPVIPDDPVVAGIKITMAEEVIKETTGSVCNLQTVWKDFCALSLPVLSQTQPPPIVFTSVNTVDNVHDESDGLYQAKSNHWVLCNDTPTDTIVVPYDECDPEGANIVIP